MEDFNIFNDYRSIVLRFHFPIHSKREHNVLMLSKRLTEKWSGKLTYLVSTKCNKTKMRLPASSNEMVSVS